MATKDELKNQIPSMQNWGGIRSITKRLERSATIVENREAVAYTLLCMANTKITDIMEWDEAGNITVKSAKEIPEHALQAIKNIRQKTDKDGNSTIEIEMFDKIGVLRILAKASGLLDAPDESDKPSVIGVNIKPPDVIDVEER
jgi:uncharacterized protein (UPF0305 family)